MDGRFLLTDMDHISYFVNMAHFPNGRFFLVDHYTVDLFSNSGLFSVDVFSVDFINSKSGQSWSRILRELDSG